VCVTAMRRTVPERAKGMRGIECFVQCKKGFSLSASIEADKLEIWNGGDWLRLLLDEDLLRLKATVCPNY